MRVQHNIAAMNSYRNYGNNTKTINKNLEKLSSGYKINRAGDDAAGLAISEKMRAQITGLEVAQKNAKDGISLVQTAEGALTEVHSMLNRMFELAEQSANGTYDKDLDRQQLQKEVSALRTEINRIRDSSNFNGQKLLNGELDGSEVSGMSSVTDASFAEGDDATTASNEAVQGISGVTITWDSTNENYAVAVNGLANTYTATATFDPGDSSVDIDITNNNGDEFGTLTLQLGEFAEDGSTVGTATITMGKGSSLQLQIGDSSDSYNQLKVNIGDIQDKALGIDTIDISNVSGATGAMKQIKDAINTVSDIRGGLGAIQNRLEHTINNLSVMQENMQDAESTIRDTDVAAEMMKYTKNSILVQSAQAMLAQANQQPQGVLQLLQ
jgi:flagellin